MNWLNNLLIRSKALFNKHELDRSMDDEMRTHVKLRTRSNIASGMSPDEAHLAAMRQFGWTDSVKDACRDQRNVRWIEDPGQDLRFAMRQLLKNPGFTAVAVLTLALGIGSSAAVFGLIEGVLFAPPPYAQPDQLVLVNPVRSDGATYTRGTTAGQWAHWRKSTNVLSGWAAYAWTFNFLVLPEGSASIEGMVVTKDFFNVVGLRPYLGRNLEESDLPAPKSRQTTIVLGYELWQKRFNGDPHIVGKPVQISRFPTPLTVVGVMPPGVRFLPDPQNAGEPSYDVNARVDFWMVAAPDESNPKQDGWTIVARLREGVSVHEAQAEMAALSAKDAQQMPDLQGIAAKVRLVLEEMNQEGRRVLMPLFGAVALLFLIACGNVTGLLLARGLQRQREYAVRSALGAGRSRVFRLVLTESFLLALGGAGFGALIGTGIIRLLQLVGGHAVPRLDGVGAGWPIFAFGFAAAIVATAVAGLLPAVRASRCDPSAALKGGRSSAGRAERRLLGGIAIFQTALTLALLAGAVLLIRTVSNLANVKPGYNTGSILTMTVTEMENGRWKDFHTRALEQVSAIPGVSHAAFVWGLPLTGNKWGGTMEIAGQPASSRLKDQMDLPLRSVTPDYFDALGTKVLQGRGFRASDDDKAPGVAVINQALADRYFHGTDPIGQHVRFLGETNQGKEIVGIISNTRTEALNRSAEPEIYFPFWQSGAFSKHLIVKTTAEPRAIAATIQRVLHGVDPTAAVENMKTMEDIRTESVAARIFAMRLLFAFAIAASVLALVGIYGVLSLSVDSRLKEIAVRMAIGAQRSEILGLIIGEGFRLIAIGLVLGSVAAVALGRLLASFLFDVQPADPLNLVTTALLFSAVALVAFYVPARRAARVEPMVALRSE